MVVHRRGPWSQAEDRMLIELVQSRGPHNWVRISHDIKSRSPKQCRERYHQNLKPNLNHNPITAEEGEAIERMVAEMGKKWAEIARRLNGRSDNAVKNWWNGGQHRRKRNPERQREAESRALQPVYPYSIPSHQHEQRPPHASAFAHPILPPIRDFAEPAHYVDSRRPSLNVATHSPHSVKLPHPQAFEVYPGSRPQPLQLPPPYAHRRVSGYETPLPSPGHSIASVDAPSLITDNGSESRSPRAALSPFADPSSQYGRYRRRSSLQLPPVYSNQAPFQGTRLAFSEPDFRAPERHPLPSQHALSPVYQHSAAPSPSSRPAPLPSYPQSPRQPWSAALSPPSRQLPLPGSSPKQATETRSAPVTPYTEGAPRDRRMRIDNIL